MDRIKQNLGVPWRQGPTDTFKTGDAATPITGIATTVMSTFDVIRKASAAKKNMVITHEPTFWTGNDNVQGFVRDAVYQQKLQFIRNNNIVVWRFHDNLHARQPDMTSVGLAQAIGWDRYASKTEARVYELPRGLPVDSGYDRLPLPMTRPARGPVQYRRREASQVRAR